MVLTFFIFLILILKFSVQANAAELTVGSGGTYATLTAALAAAGNGDIITLLSDISESVSYTAQADKTITIDGNGYKLTAPTSETDNSVALTISGTGKLILKDIVLVGGTTPFLDLGEISAGLYIPDGADVTILREGTVIALGGKGVTSAGVVNYTGTVNITGACGGNGGYSFGVLNDTGTVNACVAQGGTAQGQYSAGAWNSGIGTVNVAMARGGQSLAADDGFSAGAYNKGGGTINVTDAYGGNAVDSSCGVVNSSSGTVNVKNAYYGTAPTVYTVANEGGPVNSATNSNTYGTINTDVVELRLNNGSGSCVLDSIIVAKSSETKVGILPGVTLNGQYSQGWYTDSALTTQAGTTVTSGTEDLDLYSSLWTLHTPPAQIGSTLYSSVEEALAAAGDGEKITLTRDVTETVSYTAEPDRTVIIDGNGYTLTAWESGGNSVALTVSGTGTLILKDILLVGGPTPFLDWSELSAGLYIPDGADATILSEGTVTARGGKGYASAGVINYTGTVNITSAYGGDDGGYSYGVWNDTGTVNACLAQGGTAKGKYSAGVWNSGTGTVNVATAKGGQSTESADGLSAGAYNNVGGTINVTDAYGGTAAEYSCGVVNSSSGTVNVKHAYYGTAPTVYTVVNGGGPVNSATNSNTYGTINTDVVELRLNKGSGNCVLDSIIVAESSETEVGTLPGVTLNGQYSQVWYTDSALTIQAGITVTSGTEDWDLYSALWSPPTYSISGTITDSDSGSGIAASLQLKDTSGNAVGSAVTAASDGTYTITDVPAGSYSIEVSLTDYVTDTITGVTVTNSDLTGINITLVLAPPTVTSVTVSPSTISVQKGNTQSFTSTVDGTNSPAQTVAWSVSGNTSSGTAIDASGLLTVATDETAVTLTVTATSTVDGSKSGTATVTVTTAPVGIPGVTVTPLSLTVNENGSTATFTVCLNTQPTADVTINLSSSDTGEITVSPDVLTFTPANYSIPQTVTVTGVDDATDGNQTVTVLLASAASTDPGYNGINPDDVSITVQDDDSPADTAVSIAAIPGVTAPVKGAIPVSAITETAQYTGTVEWSPDDDPFEPSTVYTATITLIPKAGYTLTGVAEDFFTVAGADSVSNNADSGEVTAVFPETAAASVTPEPTELEVVKTEPENGAKSVSRNKTVKITFSDNIQAGANIADITLKKGNTVTDFVYGIDDSILTLNPTGNFSYSSTYTVTIPAGAVEDQDGNSLTDDYSFNFKTRSRPRSSSSSSSSSSGSESKPQTIISAEIKTSDDKTLNANLASFGQAQINVGLQADALVEISAGIIDKLAQNHKPLTITNNGIEVEFTPGSLLTDDVRQALGEAGSALELGAKEVTPDEKEEILVQAQIGQSTGLFEIGGKIFDLTAQLKTSKGTEKIAGFTEPVAVTIDLSGLGELSAEQIAQLTAVRFEKDAEGNLVPVKLGGTYDPATKTFTFYTDRFSLYSVLRAANQVKISLVLGQQQVKVNGQIINAGTPPMLVNERTMVPLRFIGESLGAQVEWLAETRVVKIILEGEEISLSVDRTEPAQEATAIIFNNVTLVPLRYVSEALGAHVRWFPSTSGIEIVR